MRSRGALLALTITLWVLGVTGVHVQNTEEDTNPEALQAFSVAGHIQEVLAHLRTRSLPGVSIPRNTTVKGLPPEEASVLWLLVKGNVTARRYDPCHDWSPVVGCRDGHVVSIDFSVSEKHDLRVASTLPENMEDLAQLETLRLPASGLAGSLPASLGRIATLVEMDVANNNLEGSIPSTFFTALSRLRRLDLSYNHLSGELPSVEALTSATHIFLQGNRFMGALPQNLSSLHTLRVLDVSDNHLIGTLPSLNGLRALEVLRLYGNQLTGPLPVSLQPTTSLRLLDLGNNFLTGSLDGLGTGGETVEELLLGGNFLHGIPPDLSSLTHLRILDLSRNILAVELGDSLAGIPDLQQLNASRCGLSGVFPALSRGIRVVDLSHNHLEGELPTGLGERHPRLSYLDLHANQFVGVVPNLHTLQIVDLRNNSFLCPTPQWLSLSCVEVVLTSVVPSHAGDIGGEEVTVSGSSFTPLLRCMFDGAEVASQLINDTTLVCSAPSHAPGNATLALSYKGANVSSNNLLFTYLCHGKTFLFNKTCIECPQGALCADNMIEAGPGYWKHVVPDGTGSVLVLPCTPREACSGNGKCTEGYEGERCGSCVEGYYRLGSFCEKCGESHRFQFAIMLCILLAVCGSIFWVSRKQRGILGPLDTITHYFQMVAVFSTIALNWPRTLDTLFDALSIVNFNLDFMAAECETTLQFTDRWFLKMGLPLMLLALFSAVYLIVRLVGVVTGRMTREESYRVWNRLSNTFVSLLTLMYLFLAHTTVQIFDCTSRGGISVLDAEPNLICYEGWWYRVLPWAIVGLLAYVIGIPLLVFIVLYNHRHQLDTPEFLARFGLVYANYKKEYYYWEVMIMARKFGLLLPSILIGRYPLSQAIVCLMVLVGALYFHQLVHPYCVPQDNMLDSGLLFMLALMLFAGQLFYSQEASLSVQKALEVSIYLLFAVSLIYMLFFYGMHVYNVWWMGKERWLYFHTAAGEGAHPVLRHRVLSKQRKFAPPPGQRERGGTLH